MTSTLLVRAVAFFGGALLVAGCGGGSESFSPLAQPATTAQSLPRHGWISPDAKNHKLLYVSDYTESIILIFPQGSTNGEPIGEITQGVSTPAGVATDAQSNVYVANRGSSTVTIYPPGGPNPTTTITNGISGPNDVMVDKNGTLYVAETQLGTVQEYKKGDTSPDFTLTAVPKPNGMSIDKHGNVYIASNQGSPSGHVVRCKPLSSSCKTLPMQPVQLASEAYVDLDGNVLLGDILGELINIYAPGGATPIRTINLPLQDPAQFQLDTKDNVLYIADPNNFGVALYDYAKGTQIAEFTFGVSDELVSLALAPAQKPGK